jgi:hypothetical protein
MALPLQAKLLEEAVNLFLGGCFFGILSMKNGGT